MKEFFLAAETRIRILPGAVKVAILAILFIFGTIIAGIYLDRMEVYKYMSTDLNPDIGLVKSWSQWDARNFQAITENSYRLDTPEKFPFFPLYPLLTYVVHKIFNISPPLAQLFISWTFLVAGAVILYHWLTLEIKQRKLKISPYFVLFLVAIFPTSFYFCAGYSESLFFFLTVGSIYTYRAERYITSGVLVALSSATRVHGCLLSIFYLLDFLSVKKRSFNYKKLVPIFMAPLGVLSYMLFLWINFGDPFLFVTAQKLYNRLGGNFVETIAASMEPRYAWYLPVISLGLYAVYKYLGKAWLVYCSVYILLPLASGRFDSLNRYVLPLVPMFLALGTFLQASPAWVRYTFIVMSTFLLAINLLFYVNNHWVA
ncbi:MAG: mannosyltransferase family protein [Candidatus Saccharibacteria bacterium]|nr:mannosyltransferase family protein [Candidatus Saccharibacteria bacterium]